MKQDLDTRLAVPEVNSSDHALFHISEKGKGESARTGDHYTVEKQCLPRGLRTRLSWCSFLALLSLLSNLLPVLD